jgi:hypothetical protein
MGFETLKLLENITVSSAYGRDYQAGSDADTVFYSDKNRGTITIQATLELYPGDSDWVDVHTETFDVDSSNSSRSTTITGKFVFIRAAYHIEDGEIISVRYNS